jgi:hypothetical protein
MCNVHVLHVQNIFALYYAIYHMGGKPAVSTKVGKITIQILASSHAPDFGMRCLVSCSQAFDRIVWVHSNTGALDDSYSNPDCRVVCGQYMILILT